MMMARLLFAVLCSLQGRHVYSVAAPTAANSITGVVAVADVSDPNCNIGSACSPTIAGSILPPALRGLCVGTTSGNMCWDACNEEHAPETYSTDANFRLGIALMVKQFRTGQRGGASCQGAKLRSTCAPGERCTPPQSTWGRGMCTNMPPNGNQCVDMCDTKIPLTAFKNTIGKQAGTVSIVEQVRGGRDPLGHTTCPGPSVWLWLWIPILLCILVGACFGVFRMFQGFKGLKKGQPSDRNRQQYKEPTEEPFVEEGYDDYNQGAKAMEYSEEPMPVMEPMMDQSAVIYEAPLMGEQVIAPAAPVLFGGEPNLMAGLAPTTMAQPGVGTFLAPTTYSQYTTGAAGAYTVYPQASSVTSGSAYVSRPAYGGSTVVPGGTLGTQMPAYGAYGAYGGVPTTTSYPTGSMRIG